MSQIYKPGTGGGGGGGVVNSLTPDIGGSISAANINILGQTATDSNFVTTNIGASTMTVTHKYQGAATTTNAATAQTLITIPVTAASTVTVHCIISGIEASIPSGAGGEMSGVVFRGGGGGATVIGVDSKFKAESDPLISAWDFNISTSGNDLIITVNGAVGYTIEWYCIAEIVQKTFI